MKDSAKFYQRHGYLKIESKKYERVLYLVKNAQINVPNKNVLRVTQRGLDQLKGLLPDEVKQIFLAGQIFCNHLYDPPIETSRKQRKQKCVDRPRKQIRKGVCKTTKEARSECRN